MKRGSLPALTLSLHADASWRQGMRDVVPRDLSSAPMNLSFASPEQNAVQPTIVFSIASTRGPPSFASVLQSSTGFQSPHTGQPSRSSLTRASSGAVCAAMIAASHVFHSNGCSFDLLLQPTSATNARPSQRMSAAIDFEPVLLDEAMDVVAIDAGLGGGTRYVAVMPREQRTEVAALERLDELCLRLFERQVEHVLVG